MKGYPISSEGAGMIKQEMIEEICEKQATYLKGVQLEKEGAVRSLQCKDEGKKKVKVAAKVRGSGTTLYQVSGRINEDDSEIEGMSCSCPSSYSSDGICKHCVAVLMKYIQNRDTKVEHIKSAAGKAISPAKSTSYGLSRVINNYGRLEKLLYEQSDTCGKIFLEPSVSLRYGQFQVEFKLGNQKKYILKNTMMFFEALEHRERLSYGKGLEFYHTMEVFQPSSKKLVEFICREMEERRQNNPGLTGNYYSKTDNRYIRLHRGNMDGFMDAIEELQVTVDIENIEKSKWHLTKESYPLKMIIQGSPEGALIVTELLTYTYGWKYGYLWHEESIYRMNIEMIRDLKSFWDYRKDYQYNDCFISKSELPAFCKKMLPIIKKYYAIERREFNETSYLPPKAEYEFYLDTLDKYTVTCKIYAIYGDSRYNIYEKPKVIEQRDELEELKLAQQVKGWFHIVDPQHNQLVLTKDDEKLYLLLTDGMEQLQKLGTLYVSDALKSVQISSAPSVTVGVSLKGDLLELTLNSEEMPLAEMLEILKRYDRKKRFYRLKNGNFISMEEDGLCVVSEFGNHLSISGQQWDQGVITLPKFRALYLDHELKDRNGFHAIKNKEFKALIRDMKTIEDNDFEVPTSLEKVLREYQRQGFLWLKTLKSNGFGGVLADDMGLGKTLQVIAFLLSEWKQEKLIENQRFAVIVCPASLVYNWKSEIERFAPALAAITVTGTAVEREQIILNSPKEEILITSYDLLRRDMELYEQYQFQFEIIDEAQYIKNHNTKLAKSVKAIKAGFKTA
ncbi:MAG: SNF2 helicase associated domain-containing protein, partial [Lachnospiraceae bacterium]